MHHHEISLFHFREALLPGINAYCRATRKRLFPALTHGMRTNPTCGNLRHSNLLPRGFQNWTNLRTHHTHTSTSTTALLRLRLRFVCQPVGAGYLGQMTNLGRKFSLPLCERTSRSHASAHPSRFLSSWHTPRHATWPFGENRLSADCISWWLHRRWDS